MQRAEKLKQNNMFGQEFLFVTLCLCLTGCGIRRQEGRGYI